MAGKNQFIVLSQTISFAPKGEMNIKPKDYKINKIEFDTVVDGIEYEIDRTTISIHVLPDYSGVVTCLAFTKDK